MNFTQQCTALSAIIIKETKRIFRIWPQTLLPPAITTALYFLIFGHVIGSRLGSIHGYHYIQYITPGLIIMPIITSAYSGSVFLFFSMKFHRSIEEILVSPMSSTIILLGFVATGVFRAVLVGLITACISIFFTHIRIHSLFRIILVALMTSIIFALAGLINAIFARKFDDISIIPTFVLTPLTYLGGVFYAVSLLPPFWQIISKFNPIFYIIDTFRNGFLGISDHHLAISYTIMALFIIVLYGSAFYCLKKASGLRA